MTRALPTAAVLAGLLAACAGGGPSQAPAACAPGGGWSDPLTVESLMPFSTFFEILEVRPREDGIVFLCSGVRGLMIVDGTDPTSIEPLWLLKSDLGNPSYPRCQHLALEDGRVWFTNRGDEIQPIPFVALYDADLDQPEQLGIYTEEGRTFEGIATDGERAWVALGGDGVRALSWSGGEIAAGALVEGLAFAHGVAVYGDHLLVAGGPAGLSVVDIGDPDAPAVVGGVAFAGHAQSVEVDADRQIAWVAAGAGGLVAIDLSDPAAPTLAGTLDTPGLALQVSLATDHAIVADWNDVRAVDIRDPTQPRLLSAESNIGSAYPRVLGAGALGDLAFVGEWTGLYALRFHPEASAPELGLSHDDLDLGVVAPGEVATATVTVTNEGPVPLSVCEVATSGPGFAATPASLDVPPGESRDVTVTWSGGEGEATGTLTLATDDPDEPSAAVALTVNDPGLGVGDPAPEVVLDLLGGGQWQLSDHGGEVVVLAYFATF